MSSVIYVVPWAICDTESIYVKKVKGDDGEDCIDSYLYKLAATQMKDEPIKIQDTELDDNSTDNDHVLMAARNLFLYHIISDIKKRFNYDDMK